MWVPIRRLSTASRSTLWRHLTASICCCNACRIALKKRTNGFNIIETLRKKTTCCVSPNKIPYRFMKKWPVFSEGYCRNSCKPQMMCWNVIITLHSAPPQRRMEDECGWIHCWFLSCQLVPLIIKSTFCCSNISKYSFILAVKQQAAIYINLLN